eukprot:6454935-Prymnesium_polylepis.1
MPCFVARESGRVWYCAQLPAMLVGGAVPGSQWMGWGVGDESRSRACRARTRSCAVHLRVLVAAAACVQLNTLEPKFGGLWIGSGSGGWVASWVE